MRWPFSLLFRGDRDAPAADDPATAGAGAPDAGEGPGPAAMIPGPEAAAPPRPAAWRGLPPVQRSIGDAPLTVPAVPFARHLAGHRPPDPILRPLAHDLKADGPAGLVSGVATPLAGLIAPAADPADHPALPAPRGVQRRVRISTGAALATSGAGARAVDETSQPAVAADGSADLPAAPPLRVLPVVAPSATSAALAATRVGAATAPDAVRAFAPVSGTAEAPAVGSSVQRSVASPPRESAVEQPPLPPVGSASGRDVPAVAATHAASDGVPDGSHEAAPAVPGTDTPAARPAQPRTLGESRRLGLGAPLAARPGVQRVAAGPDLPLARAGRTVAPPASPPSTPPRPRGAAAAEAALPVLRVASEGARSALPSAPTPSHPAGTGHDAASAATARAVDAEPGPAVEATKPVQRSGELPLVGDSRRRPSAAPGDGTDAEPGGAGPGASLPLAVGSEGNGAGVAQGDAAVGGSAAPPPAAHPAAPPAAVTFPPAAPAAAPPLAAVPLSAPLVVARSLHGAAPLRPLAAGPSGPPPVTSDRGAAPAGPPPGQPLFAGLAATARAPGAASPGNALFAWSTPRATPDEDGGPWPRPSVPAGRAPLPVARAAAPVPFASAAGRPPEPLAVSRLADGGASAPPLPARVLGWSAGGGFAAQPLEAAPLVQRAVVVDEVATQVEAAPAAGAAEGGTGGAGAGVDDEELADRVYDRIRSRFATELLLDRERMGLLIDG